VEWAAAISLKAHGTPGQATEGLNGYIAVRLVGVVISGSP
jgi:hypothetical protein